MLTKIIIKENKDGSKETFTMLRGFYAKYPEMKKHKSVIEKWLSRKKTKWQPAQYDFTLERVVAEKKVIYEIK